MTPWCVLTPLWAEWYGWDSTSRWRLSKHCNVVMSHAALPPALTGQRSLLIQALLTDFWDWETPPGHDSLLGPSTTKNLFCLQDRQLYCTLMNPTVSEGTSKLNHTSRAVQIFSCPCVPSSYCAVLAGYWLLFLCILSLADVILTAQPRVSSSLQVS